MNEAVIPSSTLTERLVTVIQRLEASARMNDRAPDEITLVAVSKTHPAAMVQAAVAAGLKNFGENRVQEAEMKIPLVGRSAAVWHLIGHLQSNKARRAVKLFDVIHSVDSIELATKLNRACAEEGRTTLPILIQADLAKEPTKSGVELDHVSELVDTIKRCDYLRLAGLMTLPPFFDDPELTRPYFRQLCELRDNLQAQGYFGADRGELSMGMTHDFEVAISEGATMVRIGTAIFGERLQKQGN